MGVDYKECKMSYEDCAETWKFQLAGCIFQHPVLRNPDRYDVDELKEAYSILGRSYAAALQSLKLRFE
jgi:hypothetical protein